MTKRHAAAILRHYIAPSYPGFVQRGQLLFQRVDECVLLGIFIDTSTRQRTMVCAEYFAMPLFVPADSITYTIGERARNSSTGSEWFDFAADKSEQSGRQLAAAVNQATPGLFSVISNATDFAVLLSDLRHKLGTNIRWIEAEAYCWLWNRELNKAYEMLRAIQEWPAEDDIARPWMRELRDRSYKIKALLDISPDKARAQLQKWIESTSEAIAI